MAKRFLLLLTIIASVLAAGPVCAQPKAHKEELADKVKSSIDRGVQFLRREQQKNRDGSWTADIRLNRWRGGESALAVLALLNCGVSPTDPAIKDGLKYLRGLESDETYVRALQTMALAEAAQSEDAERIKNNIDWLLAARAYDTDGQLAGWDYKKGKEEGPDNSNSQYALLGLWAGRTYLSELSEADLKGRLDEKVWKQIRDFYLQTQLKKGADRGSWNYSSATANPFGPHGSLTMTTAGICGLLISGAELHSGRETLNEDGTATNCGVYDDGTALRNGLKWISGPPDDHLRLGYDVLVPFRTFYNFYGIERLGRLTGMRFLGKHDWYREGLTLVREQKADGSWSVPGDLAWPQVNTCFALLFLSKGRTPLLISKLVHTDSWPRPDDDTDWNNDRNDLSNLTKFASKQLFKRLPLAWQNLDMLQAAIVKGGRELSDDDLLTVTADIMQSPILYFNGHKSPAHRFRDVEKKLLKQYVDNGGFIFVEACCGSPAFDKGFKELAKELWPDQPLEYLSSEHPVWTSFFTVSPGNPYKLMGIKMGCSRTGLIYSPQDLSCQWESNNFKTGRGAMAFKLGANVIAYATGLEPPRPRLATVELPTDKDDTGKPPRGFFKVGQLSYGGDWQPAPRAMHNLMDHLRNNAGLDVSLKTEKLEIDSGKLVDYKFIYLHGRAEFSFDVIRLDKLRFNLNNGGLLFADACCGAPLFDKSFRKFAAQLYPDHKLQEVPLNDELFGKDLNGDVLDEHNIRYRVKAREPMRSLPPFLEGIKIDKRWVVLYSKYDVGCALERHKSSDCVGYDTESAERIAGAAVLYLLKLK